MDINQILKMLGGRDPKTAFYEECKKRNVDPNAVLEIVKKLQGGKNNGRQL